MVVSDDGIMAGARPHAEADAAGGIGSQSINTSSPLHLENEMQSSASPYLRSHKDNLVAWQEWSPKAIALATTYQRPIFLSIGYNACHWCHVMSHESFESPDIAAVLNDSFIPIKVDRESRPDLDDIYMSYVTATTGSGGWPLNVFLTPDLQPLFGGTYWPSPSSDMSLPKSVDPTEDRPLNFLDIVQKMRDIWQNERQRCLASAADITRQLQAFAAEGIHAQSSALVKDVEDPSEQPEPLDLDLLDDALDHFLTRYDPQFGGFVSGAGPKFVTPANLTFLLRIGASITRPSTHTRFGFPSPVPGILGKNSCTTAASMALHTLQSMSRSALHDHLGNGFHRYSVTPDWNLPHFEKMLHDNAQLLSVYCDAWALAKDPEILGTIYDLVEYLTSPESPIVRKDGGWYASEDADSLPSLINTKHEHKHKKEGAFYVWTLKELQTILGDRDSSILARHLGVKEHGNIPQQMDAHDEFISQNVLYVNATPSVLAKEFGLREDEVVKVIKEGKRKLLEFRRSSRAAPDVDDKIVLSWNALAISGLARAANTLASIDESRAKFSKEAAERGAAFIKSKMYDPSTGRLTRIYSGHGSPSESSGLAFVDDYAYLIHSLRTLFDLTFEQHYLDWALQLQATLDRDFSAGRNGGYLQAAATPVTSQTDTDSSDSTLPQLVKPATTPTSGPSKIPDQILNLKPGTDNSLPSPNGIIASNLLYLSSYTSALSSTATSTTTDTDTTTPPSHLSTPVTYLSLARHTINAFAPEIIQHPFLYVSLLSAVVLDTVGIKSLLIPAEVAMSDEAIDARGLRGFGRTLVRTSSLKDNEVVICEKNVCRPLRDGELDEVADEFEGEEKAPEVSVEVIERREEMARRESLAMLLEESERLVGDATLVAGVPPEGGVGGERVGTGIEVPN